MTVAIKRKADGLFLTHLVAGHARFGVRPRPIRNEGIAHCMIRIDMGDDLTAYEIVPVDPQVLESVPAGNASP